MKPITRREFATFGAGAASCAVLALAGCSNNTAQERQDSAPSGPDGPPAASAPQNTPTPAAQQPAGLPVPSGTLCVTEYAGNTVAFVDPATGTVIGRAAAGENPMSLAYGGGKVYATASGSSEVYAYSVDDASTPAVVAVGAQPLGLCYDEARSCLYVAGYMNSHIMTVNTALESMTSRVVLSTTGYHNRTDPPDCCRTGPGVGRRPVCIALSPDGSTVYAANYGTYDLARVDVEAGSELPAWDGVVGPRQMAVSHDGRTLLLAGVGGEDEERVYDLYVFDTETGKRTHKVPVGSGVAGVALTRDFQTAVVISRDEGVLVTFDSTSWTETGRCQLEAGIESLTLSGNDPLAFVGNTANGSVYCVDLATLEVTREIKGLAGPKSLLVVP